MKWSRGVVRKLETPSRLVLPLLCNIMYTYFSSDREPLPPQPINTYFSLHFHIMGPLCTMMNHRNLLEYEASSCLRFTLLGQYFLFSFPDNAHMTHVHNINLYMRIQRHRQVSHANAVCVCTTL